MDCATYSDTYYDARAIYDAYRKRYCIVALAINRKANDGDDPQKFPGRRGKFAGAAREAVFSRPEVIRLGFPFQDRNGRLLVPDIERQMAWWTANGFMKKTLPLRSIVDTSFVEEAVKALDK